MRSGGTLRAAFSSPAAISEGMKWNSGSTNYCNGAAARRFAPNENSIRNRKKNFVRLVRNHGIRCRQFLLDRAAFALVDGARWRSSSSQTLPEVCAAKLNGCAECTTIYNSKEIEARFSNNRNCKEDRSENGAGGSCANRMQRLCPRGRRTGRSRENEQGKKT
jgi:hypothetical protein